MSETNPTDMPKRAFVPGFETEEQARRAGEKFYAKTNGANGREDRDFHLVQNAYGRWHFAEGSRHRHARRQAEVP